MNVRTKGYVRGVVQGVGFRPFVYELARRRRLSGYVANTAGGVDIEVEGRAEDIESFFGSIASESPPLAHIFSIERFALAPRNEKGFFIRKSSRSEERSALISPDASLCADCLVELKDPENRRYRYPFINCTHCGPRYTIIQDIPYDRARTTMKAFKMCDACRREYEDPENRRFHAQPNACRHCGPRVALHDGNGAALDCADPVREAAALLKEGVVLAVKGLGGFHLAVDASNHAAVVRLRRRKHREEKALALMVEDLRAAKAIAHVDAREAAALISVQRPIVLLKKKRFHGLSSQIAPRNKDFGVMLPYTPLHALLMEEGFKALVMTSGNRTDEPINIDNQAAFENLSGIADYFLVHDREIYLRSDDSIVRVIHGAPTPTRRSRGYVPMPIFLSHETGHFPPVLALGAELKNTICLTKENRAFLSQHVGDMENLETFDFFSLTISHLERILEIRPQILAHDMHPDYLSSKFAREQGETPTVSVQHHHAHIVGCMAENAVEGPVIGIALDGTGMGPDGQIWGGEIFLADSASFARVGHLDYVALPGGDAAARFPWMMALSYLHKIYGEDLINLPVDFVKKLRQPEAGVVLQMIRKGFRSPKTSSCGRLFDAVAALTGLRTRISYEGQAAMELEMCQDFRERKAYPWDVEKQGDHWIMSGSGIVRAVVEDLQVGLSRRAISRRFHRTLIDMFAETCVQVGKETGLETVVLSGGTFQNATIAGGLGRALSERGFRACLHRLVPPNDGGLSLGQAVVAGARGAGREGAFNLA